MNRRSFLAGCGLSFGSAVVGAVVGLESRPTVDDMLAPDNPIKSVSVSDREATVHLVDDPDLFGINFVDTDDVAVEWIQMPATQAEMTTDRLQQGDYHALAQRGEHLGDAHTIQRVPFSV